MCDPWHVLFIPCVEYPLSRLVEPKPRDTAIFPVSAQSRCLHGIQPLEDLPCPLTRGWVRASGLRAWNQPIETDWTDWLVTNKI